MTSPHSNPEAFWNTLLDNLTGYIEMQNSNPSFAARFSWECPCGAWETARTEFQAEQAIVAHKELGKEGCAECKVTRL